MYDAYDVRSRTDQTITRNSEQDEHTQNHVWRQPPPSQTTTIRAPNSNPIGQVSAEKCQPSQGSDFRSPALTILVTVAIKLRIRRISEEATDTGMGTYARTVDARRLHERKQN